ncbi:MAG: MBOAT family protein, partial [Flavobacteriales bacterium]|nr:MBOAT family protein [Flavobacteriales bacterium]
MLFNSWGYILFILIATMLHWALPHKFRLFIIAAFSLLFYSMWRWEFSLLMVFSACVDYVAADQIYKSGKTPERKMWLLISLITNLGLLFVFKYTYFIYDGIQIFGSMSDQNLPDLGIRIILPLGISFYTFQTISYTIDTYRKVIKPEKNFLAFLTYVTFWPQLIAGPILRAKEVIPQLLAERKANMRDIIPGVERIIAGLFKKVVLADTIAVMVDSAFDLDPNLFSAYDVWAAAILFGFQIYFDFSGYSDIAIGSARILGIRFPENFNFPYLSLSPKDFWKRWHISLSSWVRDYLYLPLIGQPVRTESTGGLAVAAEQDGNNKRTFALFLAWFIMGLWHGAAWTFGIWGLYHALLLFVYRKFRILNV